MQSSHNRFTARLDGRNSKLRIENVLFHIDRTAREVVAVANASHCVHQVQPGGEDPTLTPCDDDGADFWVFISLPCKVPKYDEMREEAHFGNTACDCTKKKKKKGGGGGGRGAASGKAKGGDQSKGPFLAKRSRSWHSTVSGGSMPLPTRPSTSQEGL
jgi:hypothetical protein